MFAFSTYKASFPLIQEGQFSASGERMCTNAGQTLKEISPAEENSGEVN